MEQRQNTNQSDDEVRAYNILLQRHVNDDRLMGERNSIFLASSSILFLGFVMLPQTAQIPRIIIPILGILLVFFAFCSAGRTGRGLDFWEKQEERLEKEGQSFAYMREKGITPHVMYEHIGATKLGRLKTGRLLKAMRNRIIYTYCLPAIFFILWASSLVWVLCLN